MNNNTISREQIITDIIGIFTYTGCHIPVKPSEDSVITEVFTDLDHLDRIDIIMTIERFFDIVIDDDNVVDVNEEEYSFNFKLKTIKEFVDLVIDKLNGKKGELNLL